MRDDTSPKLEIDWLKTAGGALAAVSSAVLLSTLGAAGTIIGAALGSVVVTVGGALYSQALARSRERLVQAQTAAMRKVGVAQAEVRRAERRQRDGQPVRGQLDQAGSILDRARDDLDRITDEAPRHRWGVRLAVLPWKRVALSAVGLFAVVVAALTAFELASGTSVSHLTGGSTGDGPTIGRIVGETTGGDRTPDPGEPTPTPSPSPGEEQTPVLPEPTTPVPSPYSGTGTGSGGAPSESPSPTPETSTTPEPSPSEPALVPPTAPPAG